MQNELNQAVGKLKAEALCCVLLKDGKFYTSSAIGIKPLMIFLREDRHFFQDAVIADKVIGKAAALLMVLGGAVAVYGEVMSKSAMETLKENNIYFEYTTAVPYIKNRTGDGVCPMEAAVENINSPTMAFDELEKTIAVLMSNK